MCRNDSVHDSIGKRRGGKRCLYYSLSLYDAVFKQQGLEAVENAFAEAHPEYNITWDNVFYNQGTDYFPQLQTALAGGDQPEIIMGNPGLYPDLIEQGYVADLSDNETIKSLNLPSGDLGDVSLDGKIYGFPIDFKTWGVFITKLFLRNWEFQSLRLIQSFWTFVRPLQMQALIPGLMISPMRQPET